MNKVKFIIIFFVVFVLNSSKSYSLIEVDITRGILIHYQLLYLHYSKTKFQTLFLKKKLI